MANEAEGYRGLTQHVGPPGGLEESDPTQLLQLLVYRTNVHKPPMPSLWSALI